MKPEYPHRVAWRISEPTTHKRATLKAVLEDRIA